MLFWVCCIAFVGLFWVCLVVTFAVCLVSGLLWCGVPFCGLVRLFSVCLCCSASLHRWGLVVAGF